LRRWAHARAVKNQHDGRESRTLSQRALRNWRFVLGDENVPTHSPRIMRGTRREVNSNFSDSIDRRTREAGSLADSGGIPRGRSETCPTRLRVYRRRKLRERDSETDWVIAVKLSVRVCEAASERPSVTSAVLRIRMCTSQAGLRPAGPVGNRVGRLTACPTRTLDSE
jgi:hypothetical protein